MFHSSKKLLSSFSSVGTVRIGAIVLGHLKGAFRFCLLAYVADRTLG